MKKTLRFSAVFLCVIIFASLLFVAVKHTDKNNNIPKAPLTASFVSPEKPTDSTTVMVELPENHNAEKIIVYFGDALGRFNTPIGTFEVSANKVMCKLDGQITCPETATKLWFYTINEEAVSDNGYSLDLNYATSPITYIYEDEADDGEDVKKSSVIVIAAALLLSLVGYAWLGKGKTDEVNDAEEKKD